MQAPLMDKLGGLSILIGAVLFAVYASLFQEYPKSAALLIFFGALVYALGPMLSLYAAIAGIFTLAVGRALLGARLFKPALN